MADIKRENTKLGKEEAKKALALLQKYKTGKQNLNNRVIENERWWRFKEWEIIGGGKETKDPRPVSAWMFNSIINKHADFMDNYPSPNILPREESDKDAAKILSSVLPCILDQCDYEKVYGDDCWDKLKYGTGIYGIFWDPMKNGTGDIELRAVDILNMYWEPGVEDIQKSPHLFYQTVMDNDQIVGMYPQMNGKLGGGPLLETARYIYEDDTALENKSVVIDWYYKKTVISEDKHRIRQQETMVHYAKICCGEVLYATENEAEMKHGLYEHGLYPFVFDVMFPIKGSPAGMGYIDVMKDCQMYIDKLGQSILKNAVIGAKPRYMSRDGSGINEEEYGDLERDIVHYNGSVDGIQPIQHYPLDTAYLNVRINMIDELKETSGNRDFSQGATTSGVTAASAIAALQEAGSKLSRDMIKASYRVCRDVTFQIIELVRQFYTVPRVFRITGERGMESFVEVNNRMLKPEPVTSDFGILLGGRKPYFDIKISAQKSSPFTKISQNELAKELYNLGFFNPELTDQALMCIGMMDFDGKDEIERKIAENGTMYQKLQQMQQSMLQMAGLIAETTGDTRILDVLGSQDISKTAMPMPVNGEEMKVDAMGNIVAEGQNSTAGKARARVAASATPKV